MFVSGKAINKEIGVSADLLRKWANNCQVRVERINGNGPESRGKRFYNKDDVYRMFGRQPGAASSEEKKTRTKYAYARVSSQKQAEDLERQRGALRAAYPNYNLVSDIGSGLNWKRKGLQTILEQVLRGMVEEVVVMHKDRLCRFGFELLEYICAKSGTKLVVHDQSDNEHKSTEQELAEDLLSIVTVFSARHHGKRSYSGHKRKRTDAAIVAVEDKEDSVLPNAERVGSAAPVDGHSSVGV